MLHGGDQANVFSFVFKADENLNTIVNMVTEAINLISDEEKGVGWGGGFVGCDFIADSVCVCVWGGGYMGSG